MLESSVERSFTRLIRRLGGRTIKLKDARGEPDRLVLLRHGVSLFVELKRPGEHPRPDQLRAHHRLRRMGYCVLVYDGTDPTQVLYAMRIRCKVERACNWRNT
jgi:hypothetical protein